MLFVSRTGSPTLLAAAPHLVHTPLNPRVCGSVPFSPAAVEEELCCL